MYNSKKLVAMVVAGCLLTVPVLGGCGGSSQPAAGSQAASGAESQDSGASDKAYKIAMIADAPIADGGWNSSCYQAMEDAAKECGFETASTENVAQTDFTNMFRQYAEMGFHIIFAPGNEFTDAVKEVAPEFPDTSFILLNGAVEDVDNITNVMPDSTEIGYMAGALAGLATKTNHVGFIGGMEIDTTRSKLEGYEAAAKKVNPGVEVSSAMAGSYSDTAKGKEIASSMVTANDVDILFGDASAVDTGAIEGLKEHEGRYQIGQPSDMTSNDPDIIICSVVTDNAALLKICMEDYKKGDFGKRTVMGNLANGCLSVGTFGNNLPGEIQDEYMKVIEEIKAETFITK